VARGRSGAARVRFGGGSDPLGTPRDAGLRGRGTPAPPARTAAGWECRLAALAARLRCEGWASAASPLRGSSRS